MVGITLKETTSRGKYGVVCVRNKDGSVNREFRITGEQLKTLHNSGNGLPPRVTRKEWESGRAFVYGMDIDTGEIKLDPDGAVVMKILEEVIDKKVVNTVLRISAGDWTGTLPNINVTSDVLTNPKYSRKVNKTITSIIGGKVEFS